MIKKIHLVLFLLINYFNLSAQCTAERISNPTLIKTSGSFTGWTLSNSDVETSPGQKGIVFIRDGQINNLTQTITNINPQGNTSPIFNIGVGTYDALRPIDSKMASLDFYYAGIRYMHIETRDGITTGGAYVYYYNGASGNYSRIPMNALANIANITANITLKLPMNVPNSGELKFYYNAVGPKPVDDIYIGLVSLNTTINTPTPTIFASSTTTFCTGSNVTLTSSSTIGNQWYLNGTLISGATGQTYTANTAGTYTVIVTTSGCPSTPSSGITVTVNPIPPALNILAGGPMTFCTGGSVVLTSTYNTTGAYQWYKDGVLIPSATSNQYTATASGVYTVTRTLGGCTSPASAGTTVTVNPIPPTLNVLAGGPTTFCTGGNVLLTSTYNTTGAYQWYKDGVLIPSATSNQYTATASGVYTVTRTLGGCTSLSSAGVNVLVNLIPATPIITANKTNICKGENITLAVSVIADSYQWYMNDILIPGAISQTYIATQSGNYKVQIMSGICSATSANYNISSSLNCYCTKPGDFSTGGLITKIGITGQSKLTNWPEGAPNGFIALESKTKGFVITRLQNSNMVPIAQLKEGMLIYDIDANCIKLYNGTTWNCIKRSCNE
ncbi:hypothetical protein [Chryseobacterium sp. M5A1_1a]